MGIVVSLWSLMRERRIGGWEEAVCETGVQS
jgi:hypothetical protein